MLVVATFLISHFELFGPRRCLPVSSAYSWPSGSQDAVPSNRSIRHAIYLSFLLAFWSTPAMSAGIS
jgi:methanethiol S-methyltransferase